MILTALILLYFFQVCRFQIVVYLSQPTSCSLLCDGSQNSPFSRFSDAISGTYSLLLSNSSITNISFQFLGNNFTENSSDIMIYAFSNWELNLSRSLSIEIKPNSEQNFDLFFNTQNVTFYTTKNFSVYDIKLDFLGSFQGSLNVSSIPRSSDSLRAFFEVANDQSTILLTNFRMSNLFSLDSINYYAYFVTVKTQNNNLIFQNCSFNDFYLKFAFLWVVKGYGTTILISNSTFKNYNPYNYLENIANQTYSYIISSDNSMNSMVNSINLTIISSRILNSQFVIFSYFSFNYFQNVTFSLKILTTTGLGPYGILYFGSYFSVLFDNCSFIQGDATPSTIKGVNRASIILTADYTNLTMTKNTFSNLILRETRIFLIGSYSTILILSSTFLNVNHRCYEAIVSNCQYFLFDFMSYNTINFMNCSLKNLVVQSDNSLMKFFTMNVITLANSTLHNFGLLLNSGIYLVYVYSRNNLTIDTVSFLNYSVGFSAGFIFLDNYNIMRVYSSIFNANNAAANTGQIVYLASTNQLFLYRTSLMNLYSVFRNNIWCLQKNYVYYENCYVYNVTGSRGGLSSISNTFNNYIINKTVLVWPQCVNQGAVVYVIISDNFVKISGCTIINSFAKMDGSCFFMESSHTLIVENTVISRSYTTATGGVILGVDSNTILVTNMTAFETQSLSSGAVLSLTMFNKLQVINSNFTGCLSQKTFAGVFYSFLSNKIVFDSLILKNNSAAQDGGSLVIDDSNLFNLTNSIIEGSVAKFGDAGFLLLKQNNTVYVQNCTFRGTSAAVDAGLLKALQKNEIFFISNIFVQSNTLRNGGAFYLEQSNRLYLQNCTVYISTGGKGGLLYASSNNLIQFLNSSFANITASLEAGGFFGDKFNNFSVNSCVFSNISSVVDPGGLFYVNTANELDFAFNEIFNVSSGSSAGILYAYQNNSVQIKCNSFNLISGKSFLSLIFENSLFLHKTNMTNTLYFSFLLANLGNSLEISEIYLLVTDSYDENFLISFNQKNTGTIKDSNFSIVKSLISNINIISLTQENSLFINNTLFNFDQCQKLFVIEDNSLLHLISFRLKNFFSSSNSLIDVINARFYIENLYLKDNLFPLFLESSNSSIKLKHFVFELASEPTRFFDATQTNLTLIHGKMLRKGRCNSTHLIVLVSSKLHLYKVNVFNFEYYKSGGLASLKNSTFSVVMCTLAFGKSWENGGLFYLIYANENGVSKNDMKDFTLELRKSLFYENRAFANGSAIYVENLDLKYQLKIDMSLFKQNKALRGGVIYSVNFQNISVNSSIFSHNSVKQNVLLSKGGVFFLVNNQTISSDGLIFIQTSFSNFIKNYADVGGILYMEGLNRSSLITFKNRYFLNEASFYGNLFASETFSLRFFSLEKSQLAPYSSDDFKTYYLKDIKSGVQYSHCLLLMNGYDRFGSITYLTDENLLSYFSVSQMSPTYESNSFSFSISKESFVCLSSPVTRTELPIVNSFLYKISPFPPLNLQDTYSFYLDFKTCDMGDYLDQNNRCVPCEAGTFSFQTDFSTYSDICKTCINQDFNCFGGGNYTPKPGFWRISTKSPYFYKCLNPEACLGDPRDLSQSENSGYLEIYGQGICAEGYTNTLCALCDDGFGLTNGNICVSCEDQNYYWNVFGNLLMRILFAIYLINVAVNMCVSLMLEKPIISRIVATNLLKILTNHIQILGIILKLPINISNNIVDGLSFLLSVSPNVSEAFSLQCLLRDMKINVSLMYFKLTMAAIYPFMLVLLYLIFLECSKWAKSKMKSSMTENELNRSVVELITKNSLSYKEVIITVFSLVCLTCYADISNMALAMFGCVKISDGTNERSLLFFDLSIDCDGSYHQIWIKQLSVPIILFFMLFYPCFIVISIAKKIAHLKKTSKVWEKGMDAGTFYFNFGYFFYAYSRKFFFWDFIILVRKLFLIFVNHFFFARVTDRVSYSPIILMLLIVTLAFIAQIYCKPFQKPTFHFINHVEEASLIISFVSVSLILILISSEISDFLSSFVLVLGLIINILFFLWWIKVYYEYFIRYKLVSILKNLPRFGNKTQSSKTSERKEEKKGSFISVKVLPKTIAKKKIILESNYDHDKQKKRHDLENAPKSIG